MSINELGDMETFVRVVDGGSFSAAARILGVGQPSVSRRVRALEDALGVSLLARTTRRVSLTAAGARYAEAARAALDAAERARRTALDEAASAEGRVRIAAPTSFSTSWLAPRLPGFFALHPAVELQLHLSERYLDLVAEGMDLALRVGGPDVAELRGRRLGEVARYLVASPAWVRRHGRPERAEDLDDAHGLVFSSQVNWRGWPIEREGGTAWVRPRTTTSATSGDFLRVLALAGEGVSVLPDWLVADDLRSRRLVRLLPKATLEARSIWIVWPQHVYLRLAAEAFVEWMRDAWAEARSWPRSRHRRPAREKRSR